ncbi:MAG TPA: trypsin-like peptidase domain-containing protein [Pricia sp.]|nr:trypsin-like peptidase domain-containing protein [Pricia sp.]
MKRIASTFLVALFAGAVTLGTYIYFFENTDYAVVTDSPRASVFETSLVPTSSKGAGINEVDFTTAAENTVNAVVHVKNVTISRSQPSNIMEFFYGHDGGPERAQVGTGSGVIISQDGYIVTNNHVIANANKLQVTLNNNKTYDAELIGTDPNTDIALLKIDADRELPYLAFGDSDNLRIGEWVLAVGNPFNLTSTVTAGIVSAKARDLHMGRNQSFIQTDAAINPGNSGGALVNTNGDLVGINTAITSRTGSYIGYSFAVPSNIAKKVVDDILEYGNVKKGILGVQTIPINSPYAAEKGITEIDGVYIDAVQEDTGADDAGLLEGDIIKQVDYIEVHQFADLTGYLSTKKPGDEIKVTVDRDGEKMTMPVTLTEIQTLIVPEMGLVVKNLTEEEKKQYNIDAGVRITGVPEKYRGYGLDGKILLALGDEEIDDIHEARALFGRISKYESTVITMLNENGERERLIFQ